MINSKQRANLRSKANILEVSMQIGKDGVEKNVLTTVCQLLEARELVKIKVLPACELTAKEVVAKICEQIDAEPIQVIGSVVVIYKRSSKPNFKHIEF